MVTKRKRAYLNKGFDTSRLSDHISMTGCFFVYMENKAFYWGIFLPGKGKTFTNSLYQGIIKPQGKRFMDTKIVEIENAVLKSEIFKEAGKIIRAGGLVAFPTETVYGLGADALNPEAVGKVYAAKGRPSDNPLIVHIAKKEDIYPLVEEVTPKAKALIDAFFPAPLTDILYSPGSFPILLANLILECSKACLFISSPFINSKLDFSNAFLEFTFMRFLRITSLGISIGFSKNVSPSSIIFFFCSLDNR